MASHTPWSEELAQEIIARHSHLAGAALPVLHALRNEFGYIDPAATALVAEALNLSRAEVKGTISFYHDFNDRPEGQRVIKICRAEACQAMGCERMIERLHRLYGLAVDDTSADGAVTLKSVYCLGNCALGPSALVDGRLAGRLDAEQLANLCRSSAARPEDRQQSLSPEMPSFTGAKAQRLFLSKDASALALGADALVNALQDEAARRGIPLEIIRTGSRGMVWLEPLAEVETPQGRIAYGPITASDLTGLFDAQFLTGAPHALCHGLTEQMDWMQRQQRLTFARVGVTDPLSWEDYIAHGGLLGLQKAMTQDCQTLVETVRASGLRGRGGAAFPTGIKWKTVLEAQAGQKYIVCNADEGDSGSFADRMLMEGDPLTLIEGMVIAAIAVGATRGFIYVRSEYPDAFETLQKASVIARKAGLLGPAILGSHHAFDLEIRLGAGAYICGEETSLLESLEGRRAIVRAKPPVPALHGLFGKPTLVNNVLSLATIPWILAHGAQAYADYGCGRSRGTLPVQLAGNIRRGGLIELAFGVTLRTLIEDFGGGTLSGRPVRCVQAGGPLGAYIPESALDTELDYEALSAIQAMLGHGGLVVFDDSVDMAQQARFAFDFCAKESCGKCTPCRIGAQRGLETIDRIIANQNRKENLEVLNDLMEVMTDGSLCAMGGLTPLPVMSALRHFHQDFTKNSAMRIADLPAAE